jgi:predicted ester cyclase
MRGSGCCRTLCRRGIVSRSSGDRYLVHRGIALNLLASALMILSAVTLLGAAAVIAEAPRAAPARGQTETTVREFYDTVNAVLLTGDMTALDHVIAPHLVVHAPQAAQERGDFERYLIAVRAASPGFQLHVAEVAAMGDRVMTRVASSGVLPGKFLGLPLATAPVLWGKFDVIRIADGRVAELWGGPAEAVVLEPLAQSTITVLDTPIALERLISLGRSDWELGPLFEPRVIAVVAGELTAAVDPTASVPATIVNRDGRGDPRAVAPGSAITLRDDAMLVTPPGVQYTLRHTARQQGVEVVAVTFPQNEYDGPLPSAAEAMSMGIGREGAVLTRLDKAPFAFLSSDSDTMVVSLGRLTLPPGTALSLGSAKGQLLITVKAGTLALRTGTGEAVPHMVASGDGAIVLAGDAMTLRAAGNEPVVALAVTVLPDVQGAAWR